MTDRITPSHHAALIVIALSVTACAPTEDCACRGEVPTGTLDVRCGDTACVGGFLYSCSADALTIMGAACTPEEDAGTVLPGTDAPGRPCSETCGGCCDSSGRCQAGTGDTACGEGGGACAACASGSACRDQACRGMRICTAGDDYNCGDSSNEEWVGSECCVEGVTQCVDGDDYTCTTGRTGFYWTGARCCFELENTLCVGGDSYGCGTGSTIENWTGALCCVEGAVTCSPGTSEFDCTTGRTDRTWTGTHCCIVGR